MSAQRSHASQLIPYKFKEISRRCRGRAFSLLDAGSGNHSASIAKRWFPECRYSGLDRERGYNNGPEDFSAMDEFFELDVTQLGARRDPIRIVLTPLLALHAKRTFGFVPGGVLWDLYGFADVIVGVRPLIH